MSLDGTPYINHHKVLKKAPAVPSMVKINVTEDHQLLSLPFLHELRLGNLQRILEATYGSVFSCAENVFYALKKIDNIEKNWSALFLIREMYLTGKQRFPEMRISSIFYCKLV